MWLASDLLPLFISELCFFTLAVVVVSCLHSHCRPRHLVYQHGGCGADIHSARHPPTTTTPTPYHTRLREGSAYAGLDS